MVLLRKFELISSLFGVNRQGEVIMVICNKSGALSELEVIIPSPENLAKNLKILMDRAGYSNSQFARIMGVDPSTITKWLAAQVSPRLKDLDRIARHFGISSGALIADDFEIPSTSQKRVTPQEAILILQEHLAKQAKKD